MVSSNCKLIGCHGLDLTGHDCLSTRPANSGVIQAKPCSLQWAASLYLLIQAMSCSQARWWIHCQPHQPVVTTRKCSQLERPLR